MNKARAKGALKGWRWRTGWSLCLLFCLASVGCRKNASNSHPPQPRLQIKLKSGWIEQTWIDQILQQPATVLQYLSKDQERKADLSALWENRWAEVANKPVDLKLGAGHRVIRARIHLRLARFYGAAYELASGLNLSRLKLRLSRAKKIKAGHLLRYQLGRQLCMSGYPKRAVPHLRAALEQLPAPQKVRAEAWLKACDPSLPKEKRAVALDQLKPGDDAGTIAEINLLHHLFFTPKLRVAKEGSRAESMAQLLLRKRLPRDKEFLRGVLDTEEIKEGDITATLTYYDPSVLWTLGRYHALTALAYLNAAPKGDRYAPFFRALAQLFLKQKAQAKESFTRFLKQPPKAIDWSYMLFSPRWSITSLLFEARVRLAQLLAHQDKALAISKLQKLAAKKQPSSAFACLALLKLTAPKSALEAEMLKRLTKWVHFGNKLTKRLFVRYTKASEAKLPKQATAKEQDAAKKRALAANAVLKWQLHRYAARPLILWASQGALARGEVSNAVRWLERLHRKDNAYQIGGFNEAYQFILTARAYIKSGKMGIATLYFAKSKDTYPALTQIWSLLRILRIYKGTEGGVLIVMPKGG